jgi:hypothetical protein
MYFLPDLEFSKLKVIDDRYILDLLFVHAATSNPGLLDVCRTGRCKVATYPLIYPPKMEYLQCSKYC